jgi:glucose/arabinose dehydrogenase
VRTAAATALLAALLPALVVGCSDDPGNEPNPDTATADPDAGTGTEVSVEELATGLETPWGMVVLDDGTLLFGSRDSGEIRAFSGSGDPEVVGSLDVRAEGESGLLGLTVTPDESQVLAYYTTESDSRVVAMAWDGSSLGAPDVVVEGIPGGEVFHQGGGLTVGPDDLLYVSTGDNGDPDSAQDRDSLSGKVLRYTLDGEPAPGNPFDDAVYSWGHRNVQGLAFDDAGRLWASEFGQNTWDELNLIEPGDNYGWPEVEGTGGGEEFTDPQVVWDTSDASPSGLAFWDGSLWMTALAGRTLWEIPLDGAEAGDPIPHLRAEHGRLRNVVVLDDRLVVATSNTDGRGDPAADDDRLLSITR